MKKIFSAEEERNLIYPLDETFIKELSEKFVKKIRKIGFKYKNIIELETKYLIIPNEKLSSKVPSEIFSCIIFIWKKKSFFRVFLFNEKIFDLKDNILKANLWHNRQQILNEEKFIKKGFLKSYKEMAEEYVDYFLERNGEEGIFEYLDYEIEKEERHKHLDAISDGILILWLKEYLIKNFKKYKHKSIRIPKKYKEIYQRDFDLTLRNINQYSKIFKNVSYLFKNVINDMEIKM